MRRVFVSFVSQRASVVAGEVTALRRVKPLIAAGTAILISFAGCGGTRSGGGSGGEIEHACEHEVKTAETAARSSDAPVARSRLRDCIDELQDRLSTADPEDKVRGEARLRELHDAEAKAQPVRRDAAILDDNHCIANPLQRGCS